MSEKSELTCIVCPSGCRISVETEGGKVISVAGNKCRRGDSYARTEAVDPRRSLTTTVRITGAKYPVLPVKSAAAVPKAMIFEIMDECSSANAAAPVKIGDIIIKNVLGTGIDIVASANMDKDN